MKSILINAGMFVLGSVTGGFLVWNYCNTKFSEIIEDMKEHATPAQVSHEDIHEEVSQQVNMFEYETVIRETGYNEVPAANKKKPYVITPEEVGDCGYDQSEYTLYADGVITDDTGEPTDDDDVENFIGRDNLTRMGEYDDDTLFVRNDELETDFVICRDNDTYSDIVNFNPYPVEDE